MSFSDIADHEKRDETFIDSDTCILDLKGDISGLIPPELFLQITINYEESYLSGSNGSHVAAEAEIKELLTHAQAYFFDPSLQTKIHLEVVEVLLKKY